MAYDEKTAPEGTEPERSEPHGQPLVLRPSRGLGLLWLAAGVCVVVAAFLALNAELTAAGTLLTFVGVAVLHTGVPMLFGLTSFGPDGIRDRRFRRSRYLPWSEVEAIVVEAQQLVRVAQAARNKDPKVVLTAPRDKLFGRSALEEEVAALKQAVPVEVSLLPRPDRAAQRNNGWVAVFVLVMCLGLIALFDRPWNNPAWPGRHEATAVPDACAAGGTLAARLAGTYPASDPGTTGETSKCEWHGEKNHVTVSYTLSEFRPFHGSATSAAQKDYALDVDVTRTGQRSEPVPGLGDESARITGALGTKRVDIIVRRANVIVRVSLSGSEDGTAQRTAADVERLARQATERIRLG